MEGTTRMDDTTESEMGEAMLNRMQRPPLAKRARTISGLSQNEFARVYGIAIETIRDWEQGRATRDAAVLAYLTAIANDPKADARAYGAAA